MSDPGIGTEDFVRYCCGEPDCPNDCERKSGGSIDLLTALDLLGKAEQSRDTWRRIAEQRKGAELQASFWKSRYDVQHGTVHRLEDAVAAAEARVAELEAEPVKLRDVIDKAVIALCNLAEELEPTHREIAERIWTLTNDHLESAALAAVRQGKP
jgi:hypothetical protein